MTATQEVATKPQRATHANSNVPKKQRIIQILIDHNPKRPKSRAHKKFAILMKYNGKSVEEYLDQEGRHPSLDTEAGWPATEIRWALKLGLVSIK